MPALEVKSLVKRFGAHTVLDDFSFSVEEGRTLALLGPSGCGKSTVLRILAGLAAPDAGTVTVHGALATGGKKILLNPMQRRVAMVFQDLALWPHLTVEKHLQLGLAARSLTRAEKRDRIDDLLRRFEIERHRKKYPGAMSGGEKQRLALARALCVDPKIFLLDEPLGHLDAELKDSTLSLLRETIAASGMTAVYVTHDPTEADRLDASVLRMTASA